ncbi:MAG: NEW3 domain-containing protein [Candidatus Poseidoniaceae archaeon]
MDPRQESTKHASRRALLLVGLLMLSVVPALAPVASADGARDASITIQTSPSNGQEVNPGESGEYIVRIYNTGSMAATVTLSTAEEATQECGAYSSTISPPTLAIESGDYGEASMNVTLTQTAEGTCDTTITANANDAPTPPEVAGAPAQETKTVTTTAGDGSGSAVFGVEVTMPSTSKTWGGQSVVEYDVEVENTGQTNETVALSVEEIDGSGCQNADDLTVELDEDSVNLDQNESVTVVVSVEVPDGQAADKYCWEVTGVVTSDPTQNASDSEEFDLTVPELHECEMTLSKSTITVDPGSEGTLTATLTNEGNSDWSVTMSKSSSPASRSTWVSFDGASSGLLPYDGGDGTRSFDIKVSPDDSVTAGVESVINILGKDGSQVKCSKELRVKVGQSYGASISLSQSLLPNIEPGSNGSTTITVTNDGNGPDNLRVSSSSAPSGWSVRLDSSTVSVGSKHGAEKSADVTVTVDVPITALATEEIDLTFSVLPSSGGAAYDEVVLRVTVKAVHGMEATAPATDQTGRSGSEVRFPITIENLGNVKDSFRCSVMQQTATPAWGVHYEDENGVQFVDIEVEPRSTKEVFLVVSVDGEEELAYTRITSRITNRGDSNSADADGDGVPDNQREFEFLAILSDRNFAMDVRLVDGGIDQRSGVAELPPSGSQIYGLWVENTGDGNDEAIFDLTGLQGIATRQLTLYGLPIDGPVSVPVGYGIWDFENQSFLLDVNNVPITSSTRNGAETIMIGLPVYSNQSHEARPFKLYMELELTVNPGASTGEGGVLDLTVTSVSNAANRSGQISITLDVKIVYELEFESEGFDTEMSLEYPDKLEFTLNLTNTGNTRANVLIFASESFRGWNTGLDSLSDDSDCSTSGSDFTCWMDVGETVTIDVIVRPPFSAEIEDTFKFTISAEPIETGVVDRENIEIEILGVPSAGFLGLGLSTEQVQSGFLIVLALPLLLLIYRVGMPSIQNSMETSRRVRKQDHVQNLIDGGHNGITLATMKVRNPVPFRNPNTQFALSMVTFGIYGLYLHHQYSNEMKQYANVGKGGFKLWNLIFLLITPALPFWMIARVLGFLKNVKQLEARTGHATKLSFGFILLWSLIGMIASGGTMLFVSFLPDLGGLEMIKTLAPMAVYIWSVYVPWKAFEDSLNASWTLFFTRD